MVIKVFSALDKPTTKVVPHFEPSSSCSSTSQVENGTDDSNYYSDEEEDSSRCDYLTQESGLKVNNGNGSSMNVHIDPFDLIYRGEGNSSLVMASKRLCQE